MMLLRRFEIHQPTSVAEAVQMLAHFGEDASFYAGGTELLLAMKHDVLRYKHLIDVKVVSGLDSIELRDGILRIGATATHRSVERSPLIRSHLPVFVDMEQRVANVRVRNTGTLGGNLCFADPHSDPATLLLALGASVVAEGPRGRREIPMEDFITDAYETSLGTDEVLTGIQVPAATPQQRAAYVKFQVHERPMLGLALVLETSDNGESFRAARVAVCCVSPRALRSAEAESLLTGSRSAVEGNLLRAADALADSAELMDDPEGSAEYKRNLIQTFLRRAFQKAVGQP
ncbi:MAG: xanthine dehydrogenase family protein subunit M [Acidobacteria bacterium]|nr:xanthine dehydrogenase family protein subunit M [Acidobacteriota bacterium]